MKRTFLLLTLLANGLLTIMSQPIKTRLVDEGGSGQIKEFLWESK